MGALEHPNIVSTYAWSEDQDYIFMCQEHCSVGAPTWLLAARPTRATHCGHYLRHVWVWHSVCGGGGGCARVISLGFTNFVVCAIRFDRRLGGCGAYVQAQSYSRANRSRTGKWCRSTLRISRTRTSHTLLPARADASHMHTSYNFTSLSGCTRLYADMGRTDSDFACVLGAWQPSYSAFCRRVSAARA